jgi:hypothetical protein
MARREPWSTACQVGGSASARRLARLLTAAVLVISAVAPSAGQPSATADSQQITGCCVCRGPVGAQPDATKSCTDGLQVSACMIRCQGESATSVVFGRDYTCATGCIVLAPQTAQ